MVSIEGIQVDIADSTKLSINWALFIIEFEYDSRIMVCHVFDKSIKRGISDTVKKIFSQKVESPDLRESLLNSGFISIEIIKEYSPGEIDTILIDKYKAIRNNKSYYPYGYNFLLLTSDSYEKKYAYILHNALISDMGSITNKHLRLLAQNKKHKKSKKVYRYDKTSGLFINEYDSIKEASEDTGICQSNISMCCKKHINTAGGYIWSFEKMSVIEIPTDARRKEKIMLSAAERSKIIAERQKEFIAKNQNQ